MDIWTYGHMDMARQWTYAWAWAAGAAAAAAAAAVAAAAAGRLVALATATPAGVQMTARISLEWGAVPKLKSVEFLG